MLLLTSLGLVMRLTKLARDKGKNQKANGAISEKASGISPLPVSSVSFITVINSTIVLSILPEVSSPKIGERQ